MSQHNENFIHRATMDYMTNPSYYSNSKCMGNDKNRDDGPTLADKRFYKKRILTVTRELFKPNEHPTHLKILHEGYINYLIEYLKMIDTKDILQEEYEGMTDQDTTGGMKDCSVDDANKYIYNIKPPHITMDDFVTKKTPIKEVESLPQKKNINLKDPVLRTKGVRKKNK